MTPRHYNCKKESIKENFHYNLIHLLFEVRKCVLKRVSHKENCYSNCEGEWQLVKRLSGLVGNRHQDDRFTFALSKLLLSTVSVCDVTSSCIKSIVCWADAAKLIWTLRNYDGDGKENVKKAIGFNEQNNNSACASHFFVHFFAVPAQLRREMTKF